MHVVGWTSRELNQSRLEEGEAKKTQQTTAVARLAHDVSFLPSLFLFSISFARLFAPVSVCRWQVLAKSQVESRESRVKSQDERNSTSGGRPPNCPLGGFLPPRAPYRGALIPGTLGMSAPHQALGPVSEAAGAVTETLPVFVLILPICPFCSPSVTINDRSSTTWDTRHRLHVLADGHGEVHVHPMSPFTLNWFAHQLNYTTLHCSAASSSSSKPQSLVPRPAVDHPSPRRRPHVKLVSAACEARALSPARHARGTNAKTRTRGLEG